MSFMSAMAECGHCGRIFNFNPALVPSFNDIPFCRACVEAANPIRIENGLEPIVIQPGPMRFFICDSNKSPCVFTERSWKMLKEGNGDLKRCIRHGQLICHEYVAKDKAEATRWARAGEGN